MHCSKVQIQNSKISRIHKIFYLRKCLHCTIDGFFKVFVFLFVFIFGKSRGKTPYIPPLRTYLNFKEVEWERFVLAVVYEAISYFLNQEYYKVI